MALLLSRRASVARRAVSSGSRPIRHGALQRSSFHTGRGPGCIAPAGRLPWRTDRRSAFRFSRRDNLSPPGPDRRRRSPGCSAPPALPQSLPMKAPTPPGSEKGRVFQSSWHSRPSGSFKHCRIKGTAGVLAWPFYQRHTFGVHLSFPKTSSEGGRLGQGMGMKRTSCVTKEYCSRSNTMKNHGFRVWASTGYVKRDDEKSELRSTVTRHVACTDGAGPRLAGRQPRGLRNVVRRTVVLVNCDPAIDAAWNWDSSRSGP